MDEDTSGNLKISELGFHLREKLLQSAVFPNSWKHSKFRQGWKE